MGITKTLVFFFILITAVSAQRDGNNNYDFWTGFPFEPQSTPTPVWSDDYAPGMNGGLRNRGGVNSPTATPTMDPGVPFTRSVIIDADSASITRDEGISNRKKAKKSPSCPQWVAELELKVTNFNLQSIQLDNLQFQGFIDTAADSYPITASIVKTQNIDIPFNTPTSVSGKGEAFNYKIDLTDPQINTIVSRCTENSTSDVPATQIPTTWSGMASFKGVKGAKEMKNFEAVVNINCPKDWFKPIPEACQASRKN